MDSFPQFSRCSLAQWNGYPLDMRDRMLRGDVTESWYIYDQRSWKIKEQMGMKPSEFWVWRVDNRFMSFTQTILMKVILE